MRRVDAVLIVVVVIMIVLFGYFLSGTPKQNTEDNTSVVTQNKPVHHISVSSEVAGLTATITDSAYIEQKLSELDFWTGKKKIYETHRFIYDNITSLQIILTGAEQQLNQVYNVVGGQKKLSYAANVSFDQQKGAIKLYLYASPEVIEKLSMDALAKAYSANALRTLYGIKNDVSHLQDLDYIEHYSSFLVLERQ